MANRNRRTAARLTAPDTSAPGDQAGNPAPGERRAGHTAAEIATQPDTWARAATLAATPPVRDVLPAPGERVAVAGCGTSWFVAQAFAARREASGQGWTDAFAASQFPRQRIPGHRRPGHRVMVGYDRLLVLTRSGTTTEVLDLVDAMRGRLPSTVLTASPGTPVCQLADHVVSLAFADERSVVQTRSATTALALLRAHLGEDLTTALADCTTALAGFEPTRALLGAEQFTFLGSGWGVGLAAEAALKLRETAGAWADHHAAMEYRHGPMSTAAPGRVVWALDMLPPGLSDEIAATGAVLVTPSGDPMAELVRVQQLAVALAARRGLDPDHPRHLSRSVVLAGTTDRP